MENLIKTFRDNNQVDFQKLWNEAVFVFDTNVFLDLYKLPSESYENLKSILSSEIIIERTWIPFQVLLEFLNNTHNAISDQKSKFDIVKKHVTNSISKFNETFNLLQKELNDLNLKKKHSLINPDEFINHEKLTESTLFLRDFINRLDELEKEHPDVHDTDKIKQEILTLYKNKIGASLTKEELDKVYSDGKERYKKQIPPGYMDDSKDGSYINADIEYIRKFGDLIIWNEIIKKAKAENLKYIIYITGDVKDDWWYSKRGKRLGPRKEMLNEIYSKVESLDVFYMYDTSGFLLNAKKMLNIAVNETSIDHTKSIIRNAVESRISANQSLTNISEMVYEIRKLFNDYNIAISSTVKNAPTFRIDKSIIYRSIVEIITNAIEHGEGNRIRIDFSSKGYYFSLRFKNNKKQLFNNTPGLFYENKSKATLSNQYRSSGLANISSDLSRIGCQLKITDLDDSFIAEIVIPNDHAHNQLWLFNRL